MKRVSDAAICTLNGGPLDGATIAFPKPVPERMEFTIAGRVFKYLNDHPVDDPDICTHHSYSHEAGT